MKFLIVLLCLNFQNAFAANSWDSWSKRYGKNPKEQDKWMSINGNRCMQRGAYCFDKKIPDNEKCDEAYATAYPKCGTKPEVKRCYTKVMGSCEKFAKSKEDFNKCVKKTASENCSKEGQKKMDEALQKFNAMMDKL